MNALQTILYSAGFSAALTGLGLWLFKSWVSERLAPPSAQGVESVNQGSPGRAGVLRGDLRGLAACSSA